MTEKQKVRIFFCGDAGEVNADVYVTPEVTVTQRDGVAQIAIGNRALEISVPDEIFEKIREH